MFVSRIFHFPGLGGRLVFCWHLTQSSSSKPWIKRVMFPTPDLSHLTSLDYEAVYEPAEDSFLLMDALEADKNLLSRLRPSLCVEVGSGSGVVLTFLSKLISSLEPSSSSSSPACLAIDINPEAAKVSRKTAAVNAVDCYEVINSDLLTPFEPRWGIIDHNSQLVSLTTVNDDRYRPDCIFSQPDRILFHPYCVQPDCHLSSPRLHSQVDILLFNPPYVVTPPKEVVEGGLTASWAGGLRGREVTDRLLPVVSRFLSRPDGLFYLVTIPENDPKEICDILKSQGLTGEVVLKRRAGPERLAIYRFAFAEEGSTSWYWDLRACLVHATSLPSVRIAFYRYV